MRAIRTDRYKYIRNFEATFLVEVPGDIQGDVALAAVERDLEDRLWRWMEETGDPLLGGPVPSPAYRQAIAQRPTHP
jgi:hypothetical protein